MWMASVAEFLVFGFVVLGGYYFLRGLVGDRIGDRTFCAACGYDLFGLPRESKRCPECGVNLRYVISKVVGRFRRQWWRVFTGVVLLLLAYGTTRLERINWLPYESVPMLLRQEQAQPWEGSPASWELYRRLQAGLLSQAQIDVIADRVLARQANLNQQWNSLWGDFLERARASGKLSDGRWAAYADQGLTQSLSKSGAELERDMDFGQLMHVSAYISGNRMGGGSGKMLHVSTTVSVTGNGLKHMSAGQQNDNSNLQFPFPAPNQDYIINAYDFVVDKATVREARTTVQTMRVLIDLVVSDDSDYVGHGRIAKVLAQKHLDFTVRWKLSPTSDEVIQLGPE
jgi:hypothetical protein